MAAIDSLLKMIGIRNAELLVLATGEVPVLRRGGANAALALPPLDAAMVETFVGEIASEEQRGRLASGAVEVGYAVGSEHFTILVERRAEGFRLSCRPGAPTPTRAAPRATAPVAPPPPPATTGAAPAPAPAMPASAAPLFDLAAATAGGDATPLLSLIARAEGQDASDILVSSGMGARLRVGGRLHEADGDIFADADILALVAPALPQPAVDTLQRTGSVDLALDLRAQGLLRYRVNLFRQSHGLAAALRPIRDVVPTLEDLGLPGDLYELTRYPTGLVLITGPAGAGKSTTLVALIEHINRTRAEHVITLEDPIEYVYRPARALIHQREIGLHVDSFATGLRAALRESPDVIMLGEMRDRETIAAALTAAETGHLVLATMHAGGAAVAIDRVIDVFPEDQQAQIRAQLAITLRAVVTQFLLPARPAPTRVPAYEKMVVTSAIAAHIREGKVHHIPSAITTGRDKGMMPLERSLAQLVRTGRVDRDVARAALSDPDALDPLL